MQEGRRGTRDLAEEKYAFEERLAICTLDGGLSEKEALEIADAQLWKTIRETDATGTRT
jgi:hypothetical protein